MSIALRNYQAEICREIDRLDHPLVPLPTDELRILQAAEESEREVIAGLVAGIAGAHPGALDREAAP
jgi:hypothetical protein